MNNKEAFENKVVKIYAPCGCELVDVIKITNVIGKRLQVIKGVSINTGIEVEFYLNSGISVEIVEEVTK